MRPETENARATGGAGWKSALPAWDAVTVQTPAPLTLTTAASTEHAPVAVKAAGSVDDAVADTANGGSASRRLGIGPNVMVCAALPMATVWDTSDAAR